jgi:hypothetical protein
VLVLTEEVINRIEKQHLEILLAHEIILNQLRAKFSRGVLEREILLILSDNGKKEPEYLVEKELNKFFKSEEVINARNSIRSVVEELIQGNYPVLTLD